METPCIVINEATVRRNIQRMVAGLRAHGIAHRPHFKTHKSVRLAKMQLEMGAAGITCASLGEGETLADGGVTDIFLAYPIIGARKLARLVELSRRTALCTVVNSIEGAEGLNAAFAAAGTRIKVLIELDGGMGRSGITLDNINAFAQAITALPGLELIGVMTYRGNIYQNRGESEYVAETRKEAADLLKAQRQLQEIGIQVDVISSGSSFSSKFPQHLQGLTEARAGTYIYNDVSQLSTGMIQVEDCALTVLATVVTCPDKNHAVIDAGSKTLSSDLAKHGPGYGYILEHPNATIEKLSEEHGYLRLPDGTQLNVGDTLHIIPNHVCAVVNLADTYWAFDGQAHTEHPVDARGKSR
ncbi:MAG: alanine racemase [Defluviitaleaceae bacterium]|nr:alanine racemase [Defluviitaleaceae bacterium]